MAEYFLELTLPYAIKGYVICAETHPMIDLVWDTYNSIFSHLDAKKAAIEADHNDWRRPLLPVILAAKQKLTKYFDKTKEKLGDLYNFGTILNPMTKLEVYELEDWGLEERLRFRTSFVEKFKEEYEEPD
jgi:hypothetical protein